MYLFSLIKHHVQQTFYYNYLLTINELWKSFVALG